MSRLHSSHTEPRQRIVVEIPLTLALTLDKAIVSESKGTMTPLTRSDVLRRLIREYVQSAHSPQEDMS